MKTKSFIFLILMILTVAESCRSQQGVELTTRSKKAEKAYLRATQFFDVKEYDYAITELKKAIKYDPFFVEAYLLLGDASTDLKKLDEAIDYYKKAIEIDPDFFPRTIYNLADLELARGRYEDARSHFRLYLSGEEINQNLKEKITRNLHTCDFAMEAMKHPVPFNPVNLGPLVNSPNEEHSPSVTADDMVLIFTMVRPRDEKTACLKCKEEEDIYFSRKIEGYWTQAVKIGPPLNSHYNEGVLNISPDGQTIFFTSCNRPDSYGSCDLYSSAYIDGGWAQPVNLGPVVNSRTWDSQPSVASDGRTLYFASAREGGKGNVDIWKSTKQPDGSWSTPENLGDSINTPYTEMAPFIHPDNQTLYFISNGHIGMGGMDIFYSRKNEQGDWQNPVNIGYPINTYADERSLIVNARGDKVYFSSNLPGGSGKFDLYYFDLYEAARPNLVTFMKGVVYDKETKERLMAKFELITLEKAEVLVESYSDAKTGEFLVSLPTNHNYVLNVSREGYLFYSDNFELSGSHPNTDPYYMDIPLTSIKPGGIIVLKNIFFDTDKYNLKDESIIELNIAVGLMTKNPRLNIEIGGHTDNVGGEKHNQVLSLNRAKAVYDFLITHGISKERLSYQGYGYSQPCDTNETPEGRANNRRTEFKVISN